MAESVLPRSVVREDHQLEKEATSASEELARLRWHWTLDETNEKRVPLRAYARAVGKGETTIREYANGYAESLARNIPLTDAMKRSQMSAEREAATDAVAKARGIAFGTVRQKRPTEVRRVRDMARERAERHGTTVEDEATKVADWIVRSEKTDARLAQERKQRLGLRYVELEGKLARMKSLGAEVLNISHNVDLTDEEMELLQHTLAALKALLGLIDMRLAGAANVDWDAELAKLDEEMTA